MVLKRLFSIWSWFLIIVLPIVFGCQSESSNHWLGDSSKNAIDFNYDVKPILSDKCFACHGPDRANQKADLRLDLPENAYAIRDSSKGMAAIMPGDLEHSMVYQRIVSSAPKVMMPPPESHLTLTPEEKNILIKWIKSGAEYKKHWAFIPPEAIKPPQTSTPDGQNHPIDQFIEKKLDQKGLDFSKKATKETLIRRASFDLRGLPPTLEEIDAFITDDQDNAFHRLIDQFLASTAYGERMASYWLDIARYADSDGYLDDKHRDFSPWRDWVIGAFNENMPYDQFVTWQIAGDLLPQPSQESILATAFNRLNKRNSEAGIVFEEYRVEYTADRTNTIGKAFLGLSMECARCHDHKYDPITQKNYYELFAYFNNTFELGTAVYGPGQTPGPALLLADSLQKAQIDSLQTFIAQLENQYEQHTKSEEQYQKLAPKAGITTTRIEKNLAKSLVAHYPFDQINWEGEKKATTPEKNRKTPLAQLKQPIIKPGASGNAFFVSDYNHAILGKDVGWYDRPDPFSIQVSLLPDTIYQETHMLWHCEDLRLGQKGYTLGLRDNKVLFAISHSWPQNAIQVTTQHAIPVRKWSQITVTYDGSSQAKGIKIYIDGLEQPVDIQYDHLYRGILFQPNIHTYGFKGLMVGSRDKYIPFKNGGIDEVKVYDGALTALEVLYTFAPHQTSQFIKEKNQNWLAPYYFKYDDPKVEALSQKLKTVRDRENDMVTTIPEIMVMGDLPQPRPTFVLNRGMYNEPREAVQPNVPNSVFPMPASLPSNRLGLAKWLFHEKNPLTARVFVNQIWQMHFGNGLVKTAEDFGNQGSLPSHPELLDWLAIWLMDNDWDVKGLHKLIMTSYTYQQHSGLTERLLEEDPENIWLSRGPRFRLPAEMIRDNALAISGLLVNKVGGKSVYPYQPEGIWDGLTNKSWAYKYLQEPGEGLYRRSLYTIWKRTAPPPSMLIFDIADRGNCTVRRKKTSTPLQALVLLNDPQFVEAARVLAEKLIKENKDLNSRLHQAFRLTTGRMPDQKEMGILQAFYQSELTKFETDQQKAMSFLETGESQWDKSLQPGEISALAIVINGMMNTDEGYTRK